MKRITWLVLWALGLILCVAGVAVNSVPVSIPGAVFMILGGVSVFRAKG